MVGERLPVRPARAPTRARQRVRRLATIAVLAAGVLALGPAAWAQEDARACGGRPEQAADAQQPRFAVLEYRVTGNTVLPTLAVERAVYPHLGPGRTADDIWRACAALEEAYTRAGYSTVSVELPEQRVTTGIVTLRVVERPVGRLRVTGAQYFLPSRIREEAPSVAPGTVPNLNAVRRDIVGLNRLPDRRVTPELRQGAVPNTVDVDLEVQDKLPLHASLELNNRRSANTQPLRVVGTSRYDNLWQRGDSVSLAFQTAPQRTSDSTVFSGSYLLRLPGTSGAGLLASFVASNSNVSTVGGTGVLGRGTIFGLRGIVPLGVLPGFSHTVSFGIDRKQFDQNLTLGSTASEFPILYYPVSASYQAALNRQSGNTLLGATITAALAGLGSDLREYELVRAFASPSWAHLRLDAANLQEFESGVQIYAAARGQLSPYPLISNEQFFGGGLDSVRGYLEVEALGDFGVTGQAELRSPSLSYLVGPRVDEWRLHAFFDGGTLGLRQPLPEQQASFTLLSVGGGTRFKAFERVNGSLEGAVVLRDGPLTSAGSARALFRLWGEF